MDERASVAIVNHEGWPAEVRELARLLWHENNGANAALVARRLKAHGHDVPRRTVSYWARSWSDELSAVIRQIAPNKREHIFSQHLLAAEQGATYYNEVTAGQHDHPDVTDILLDDAMDPKAKEIAVNARYRWHSEARKARLQAGKDSAHIVGFSPVGSRDPTSGIHVKSKQLERNYRDMSDEDLAALEVESGQGS